MCYTTSDRPVIIHVIVILVTVSVVNTIMSIVIISSVSIVTISIIISIIVMMSITTTTIIIIVIRLTVSVKDSPSQKLRPVESTLCHLAAS